MPSRRRTEWPATRSRTPRTRARSCRRFASDSCAAADLGPQRALAQMQQRARERDNEDEEHDRDRRTIAEVVIDEGDTVEIQISRLRGRARTALRDRED